MIEDKEQCKKCLHYQVCANVMKRQLFIREVIMGEEDPKCEYFLLTADVVPRAEVEELKAENERLTNLLLELTEYNEGWVANNSKLRLKNKNLAWKIFEEIEAVLAVHTLSGKSEEYSDGAFDTLQWVDTKLAEIKKKYTEGGDTD